MVVRLTVKMRGEAGGAEKPQVVMLEDDVITLGRDPGCHIVLSQQAVSRTHVRISRDGSLYFVEDLGSSYGTQVNGAKLPKGEKRLLRNGDTIIIAQFDVVFDRVAGSTSEENSHKTLYVSRQVVKDVMKGLSSGGELPFFRIMNGPREAERLELGDAREYVIGRDDTVCDIVLKDDLVSRQHVKVRRDWSGTHVEDLGSRNGIKVNKKKLRRADLKDRDEVEIGGVRLLYIDPTEVRETLVVLPENLPEVADEEGTLSVQGESAVAAKAESDPDAPGDEEQPEEPPPATEEPPPSEDSDEESPPGDEPEGDDNLDAQDQPDGEPEGEAEGEPGDEGPRKLIDFSDRQTLIVLGVVAATALVAVVLGVLLLVGA